jgi:hypothetical protein
MFEADLYRYELRTCKAEKSKCLCNLRLINSTMVIQFIQLINPDI